MTLTPVTGAFLRSAAMRSAIHDIVAAIGSTGGVVICGEEGTGRETIARAIHRASSPDNTRSIEDLLSGTPAPEGADAPFVVVDCSSLQDVEQQLFGHVGRPAGHDDLDRVTREALLHQALGGTLFLGSLHDMPARVQTRLARILRDGEVLIDNAEANPVGEPIRIRVIASVDLAPIDGEDDRIVPELLKRLAAHRIELPSLRQRREDIPALVRLHLADICGELQLPAKAASSQAMALLAALPWRGNLKELRGLLRALVLKVPGRLVRVSDVLGNVRLDGGAKSFVGGGTLKEARERFERDYVAAVLEQHRGRMAEAAKALGIQRTNLYRKVRQLSVGRKRPNR